MSRGFTLIELVVVLAIIGIVLGVGVATLGSTLRSSAKTSMYNKVKQEGDLAMETITRSIQSAGDVCTTVSPNIDIIIYASKIACPGPAGAKKTRFRCTPGTDSPPLGENGKLEKIEEEGGEFTTGDLVNSVKIKPGSCIFRASDTTPKRVTVRFTLTQDVNTPVSSDLTAEIPFQTEVTLRSF